MLFEGQVKPVAFLTSGADEGDEEDRANHGRCIRLSANPRIALAHYEVGQYFTFNFAYLLSG